MMQDFSEALREGARQCNIMLSAAQISSMALHFQELVRWNRAVKLTAVKDPGTAAIRLYLDSLVLSVELPDEGRVLDVGSGGGFPGIPLAVVKPGLQIRALEAQSRKVHFLRHSARSLKLENFKSILDRLERLPESSEHHDAFDCLVTRATFSNSKWLVHAGALLREGGSIWMMRGPAGIGFPENVEKSGFAKGRVVAYRLPGQDQDFYLMELLKENSVLG